jgi:outer membrane protein assembly complex protein YaeT
MLVVCLRSFLYFLTLCLILGLDTSHCAGQAEQFEGRRIMSITCEPAAQPIPAVELSSLLPFKVGQPLHLPLIRTAIERLYATGRYADIAVDAEPRNGQVALLFLTKNNWFVGRVSVSGVPAPPRPSELVAASKLDLGRPFSTQDAERAVANIREVLRNNGFFESSVQTRLSYEEASQQVQIEFVVSPHRRAYFASPVIAGDPQKASYEIIKHTRWKGWFGWKKMTAQRVQRGLERIRDSYKKTDHLMAQVSLEKIDYDSATGRATVRLRVDAGPVVRIETVGIKLSRRLLTRLVPIFEEHAVDQDLLVEGAKNITDYLQRQGYFRAQVKYTSDRVDGKMLRILYTVNRGARYKLARVQIRGNKYFDEKTISERLGILPASTQIRRGRFSDNLLRRGLGAVTELYRANGFRDVEVDSQVVNDYEGRRGDMAVFIDIREGQQWVVGDLQIEGIAAEDEKVLRPLIQSLPGQPFSEANVATDRETILAHYYNNGYPNAAFEWTFQPSTQPNRVNLRFTVSPGARQFVREVLIGGLQATQPRLAYRQILLNPGDPISQALMLETQRKLYNLGIFTQVDMAIQNPDGEERDKYILYELHESRKYAISGGIGAEVARIGGSQTSLESPAGKAGFSPRASFDVSRLNFLGHAQTVSLRSRFSNLQQRVLATYLAPQFRGQEPIDLSFNLLFDDSRDVRTFSARRWEGSVQLAQRWKRSKTFLYRFAYRRVGVDQNTLKIRPELIPLLSQPVRVGILSASYVDDRRDHPSDSHRGTYNTVDLAVASRVFGSQADFTRLLARNSTYHPLGSRLVLARTTTFGWLNPLHTNRALPVGEQIPLPERFFAGGASTLRSFPENQAGPRDPVTGFPTGGGALLVIGTELRFPLIGQNIGGVLFHDAGNVYSRVQDVSFRFHQHGNQDFNYMVHDAGVGVRYRTPVGPIRADFSFSPNSPWFYGFKGTLQELIFGGGVQTVQRISRFQFHFSLGQTF